MPRRSSSVVKQGTHKPVDLSAVLSRVELIGIVLTYGLYRRRTEEHITLIERIPGSPFRPPSGCWDRAGASWFHLPNAEARHVMAHGRPWRSKDVAAADGCEDDHRVNARSTGGMSADETSPIGSLKRRGAGRPAARFHPTRRLAAASIWLQETSQVPRDGG